MKTIKLKVQINEEDKALLNDIRRQQSSYIKCAYKLFLKGYTVKQITDELKNYNFFLLDSWFAQSAAKKAKNIYERNKEHKVLFGGKYNWSRYIKGLINKEEFKEKKTFNITVVGESLKTGNRKFELDIEENNQIIFKPKQGIKIPIQLPKLRSNYKRQLLTLQELAKQKQIPFTVELNSDYVFITFEYLEINRLKSIIKQPLLSKQARDNAKEKLKLFLEKTKNNSKRVMGIDQNPNYLGISIIEFNDPNNKEDFKIIHKEVISFEQLNDKQLYNNNKKRHELIEVCKYVINKAKNFKCGKVAIEELSFKNKENKGKTFNRLTKNVWHRNLLKEQLQKRCDENNIELVEVNAAYSSFIGNVLYGSDNCPDMIAASIEMARRGFNKFKKGWFYPELKTRGLMNQWKEELSLDDVESWRELFAKIKKSKLKYRFSLAESSEFFRLFSHKSRITALEFV